MGVQVPGCLGRFRPDLDDVQEGTLLERIRMMEKALFGLTPTDVRRLAYEFSEKTWY